MQVEEKITPPSSKTTVSFLGSVVPPLQYLMNFCISVKYNKSAPTWHFESLILHKFKMTNFPFGFLNVLLSFFFVFHNIVKYCRFSCDFSEAMLPLVATTVKCYLNIILFPSVCWIWDDKLHCSKLNLFQSLFLAT